MTCQTSRTLSVVLYCLGPILFLLYINDLPDVFDDAVMLKLFADDKTVLRLAALSLNTPTYIDEHLNRVVKWSNDWQLPISYYKCCIINLGTKNLRVVPCLMDTKSIPYVDKVIDLGVTMDKNLKFSARFYYLL